jgi:hypothetical protein
VAFSGRCGPYAFSMAERRTTRTKTAQLEFVNLPDFRGFSRELLVAVTAEIALITQIQKGHVLAEARDGGRGPSIQVGICLTRVRGFRSGRKTTTR